jgi:hypothetical protein
VSEGYLGGLLIGPNVPSFRNPFHCQLFDGVGRFEVGRPSCHGGVGTSQPICCLVGFSCPSGNIISSASGLGRNHNNLVDSLQLACLYLYFWNRQR